MKDKFGLTIQQADIAANILAVLFPSRLGCHPDELYTAAGALRAAAMVCELASYLHEQEGREMLLKTACHKLYLPTAKQDAVGTGGTQETVAKMFHQVLVSLVDPIGRKIDLWEPKLIAVTGDGNNQPKCCTGCINIYATCVHSPEKDGGCVGYESDVQKDLTGEKAEDAKSDACYGCRYIHPACGHEPRYDGISYSCSRYEYMPEVRGKSSAQ